MTVLVYTWAISFVALWLWALIDMTTVDGDTWRQAGYRKALWVWAMFAPGLLIAPLAVAAYLTRVRVRIRAAEIERSLQRERGLRRAAASARPTMQGSVANWPER